MNAKEMLSGVWAPITTPFTVDEAVDYVGLKKNISLYAESGIQGYLALGSNGETKSLFGDEKQKIMRTIVKGKAPEQKVMVGCIAESTVETIHLAKMAEAEGADCITLLPPSYFVKQMTDEALVYYFEAVAGSVRIPTLVYCAPQFSAGMVLSHKLIQTIAKHPNIVGMKDSSVGNIDGYLQTAPEGFAVMAGSANFFIHTLEGGGVGGILSLANIFPQFCEKLYQLYLAGKKAEYDGLNEKMLLLNKGVSGKGGVAAVKYAMDLAGLVGGTPRQPLLPLEQNNRDSIAALLKSEAML